MATAAFSYLNKVYLLSKSRCHAADWPCRDDHGPKRSCGDAGVPSRVEERGRRAEEASHGKPLMAAVHLAGNPLRTRGARQRGRLQRDVINIMGKLKTPRSEGMHTQVDWMGMGRCLLGVSRLY